MTLVRTPASSARRWRERGGDLKLELEAHGLFPGGGQEFSAVLGGQRLHRGDEAAWALGSSGAGGAVRVDPAADEREELVRAGRAHMHSSHEGCSS